MKTKIALLAAFIQEMNSIFFEGYVDQMSTEEFNFAFELFCKDVRA